MKQYVKRSLAYILAAVMIATILPNNAFAIDGEDIPEQPELICICTEKCADGQVNENCPVCVNDLTACTGAPAQESGEDDGQEPEQPSQSSDQGENGTEGSQSNLQQPDDQTKQELSDDVDAADNNETNDIDQGAKTPDDVDAADNNETNDMDQGAKAPAQDQLTTLQSFPDPKNVEPVTTYDGLKAAAKTGGTIILGADITIGQEEKLIISEDTVIQSAEGPERRLLREKDYTMFEVAEGVTLTLDGVTLSGSESYKPFSYGSNDATAMVIVQDRATFKMINGARIHNVGRAAETYGSRSRLITLESKANLYMENSSISGFRHYQSTILRGAIYASESAKIHLVNSKITDCMPQEGGAIYATDGAKVILEGEGTILEKNSTQEGDGGAIYLKGAKLTINGATIRNNKPDGEGPDLAYGGGIYAEGTQEAPAEIEIIKGTIEGNSAKSGGGIYAGDYTTITMYDGVISNNNASDYGGGIAVEGDTSTLKICGGKISGNQLGGIYTNSYGAGIYSRGTLTIEDGVKVSENEIQSPQSHGVGIAALSGNVTIKAAEISHNIAKNGSAHGIGIYIGAKVKANIDGANIEDNKNVYDEGSGKSPCLGGGIYNEGTLELANCHINYNHVTTDNSDIPAKSNGGALYTNSKNCTVEHTEMTGNTASGHGGAVYMYNRYNITIKDCLLQKNTAQNGGAIYLKSVKGCKVQITSCKILDNKSKNVGGIDLGNDTGSLIGYQISDCEIARNASDTNGGGIYSNRLVTISNCDIHDNTTKMYGAGVTGSANAIKNCRIYGNKAQLGGGGIAVYAKTSIQGTSIYGNTTQASDGTYGGGGIYAAADTEISSSRIADNTTAKYGGGIYVRSGSVTVNSGVITSNTAEFGGGIYVKDDPATMNGDSATMNDGALFGNTAGAEGNTTTTSAGADLYAESGTTFQVPSVENMKIYLSAPDHTEVTDADRAAILNTWQYDYKQNDSGAPSGSTGVDRYQNGYKVVYNDAGKSDAGYVPLIVGVTPTYSLSYQYSGEIPENAPTLPATVSKKLEGELVEVDAAPTMEGYTFSGWTVAKPETGTAIVDGTVTMPAANVVLQGFWTKNPVYTLTYDANFVGEDQENSEQETPDAACEAGTVLTIQGAELFTRENYTLVGWNTESDGGGTTYDFGESFTVPSGNTILYACWKRNYILTYVSNGGSPVEPEQYLENDMAQVDKEITREGYTFEGWYADEALTIPITEVEMTSDKYVYAKWRKNSSGGIPHPEADPKPKPEPEPEDDTEEIMEEEVPLAETPWLNTEDHYAYIVGYPEDYVTGEPTEDESRWPVKPQANITRAEVATIFFRLLTDEARDQFWSTSNNFTDVAADAWYNNAISTMVNAGIIQGYEDGTFRPNNNITRAEFAAIASRFMSSGYDVEEDLFLYVYLFWARENINDAAMTKWINGYPDGTFLPDKAITRAEAVTLVNNVLQRKPDADHLLDSMIKWPDNMDTSAWYYEAIQEATNSHDYDLFEGAAYETWTSLLENRDWAALEKDWVNAHRTGGEVM